MRNVLKNNIAYTICLCLVVYLMFTLLGLWAGRLNYFGKLSHDCTKWYAGLHRGEIFVSILKNNIWVGVMLAAGVITAGISSLVILALNGTNLGFVLYYQHEIAPIHGVLSVLVPHGLPEVSGMLCLAAASLMPALAILHRLNGSFVGAKSYIGAYCGLCAVGLALIVIAAGIEASIPVR